VAATEDGSRGGGLLSPQTLIAEDVPTTAGGSEAAFATPAPIPMSHDADKHHRTPSLTPATTPRQHRQPGGQLGDRM
jgi:hypothetical protein